ncbi:MAG: TIGR04372 family glycosyltransferase [Sedimentisphaerales bacterium]|nr:TIGR04372 family glycosyltransferase [Sedimentisphaerales bacterium]
MKPRKQKVYYVMRAIETIGQLASEIWWLRNLYERSGIDITVITPPPKSRPKTNLAVYELVMRGINVLWDEFPTWIGYENGYSNEVITKRDPDCDSTYLFMNGRKLKAEFVRLVGQKGPRYFQLNSSDLEQGQRLRRAFGIPEQAPIVTLHVRQSSTKPGLTYHNYRDADINNYLSAIEYLIQRGYYVVRLGDKSMTPLAIRSCQVIDAVFHPACNHWVEPYFIGTSRFYLGVPSGPYSIALAMGIPTVLTNATITQDDWGNPRDIFVPKKHFSRDLNRPLMYQEVVCSEVVLYDRTELFERAKLNLLENTPEEITSAVREMDQRLDGKYLLSGSEYENSISRRLKYIQAQSSQWFKNNCKEPFYFLMNFSKSQISTEYVQENPQYLGLPSSPSCHQNKLYPAISNVQFSGA